MKALRRALPLLPSQGQAWLGSGTLTGLQPEPSRPRQCHEAWSRALELPQDRTATVGLGVTFTCLWGDESLQPAGVPARPALPGSLWDQDFHCHFGHFNQFYKIHSCFPVLPIGTWQEGLLVS